MMQDTQKDAMMEKTDDAMMKQDSTSDAMMDEKMEEDGMKFAYTAFAPSVLTDGQTKVLFFHAAWCPTCRSADADLQAWFAANVATRNVYKVDYDTSAELKAKYGVTYQHTFVLVDGQGNALKTVQGPSDDVLKSMIGAQ
jgi:thiol-disulfide isomerase/thioredoxin